MLDSAFPVTAEEVEAQAVNVSIDVPDETGAQQLPHPRIDETLKNTVLYALSAVLAQPGDASQSSPSLFVPRVDIVRH
jgi:hypothetical protein